MVMSLLPWPRLLASRLGPMAGTAENCLPSSILDFSYDGSLMLSLRHLLEFNQAWAEAEDI